MQFTITITRVKDGNGYIAQSGHYSFWAKTRMEVISDMLAVIWRDHQVNKIIGN